MNPKKIKISDNVPLSDSEFAVACDLCDIVSEIIRIKNPSASGGIFWDTINLHAETNIQSRKSRREIDLSLLLRNRFRDFPTTVYEYDHLTPVPDQWVNLYSHLCAQLPEKWHVRIPARFGEIGWNVNGFPVNRHTAILQERVNAQIALGMERVFAANAQPRALEIGGGAGEMAYVINKNIANLTWYNCDLPQSLIHSAIHMAIWLPEKKHYIYVGNLRLQGVNEKYVIRSARKVRSLVNSVVHIPHFLLGDFRKLPIDYTINAWSFSEMAAEDVLRYAKVIKRNLTKQGQLVEQNGDHQGKGGCYAKQVLREVFPVTISLNSICLSHNVDCLKGGDINAWSKKPFPFVDEAFALKSFDIKPDGPELKFSVEHYDHIDQLLKVA